MRPRNVAHSDDGSLTAGFRQIRAQHSTLDTQRLTAIGLISILLVLTGFSIWATLTTQQAARRTIVAEYLNDQYQQVRFAISTEESLERKYRLEPGSGPLVDHRTAATALIATLSNIARVGDAHDRRVVAQVLATHQRYLVATHQMFAAVDIGNTELVINLDHNKIDPIFTSMQHQVNLEAISYRAEASQDLAALDATEQLVLISTLIVFPVGLLLLWSLLLVVRTYQRRIDKGIQAELSRLERATFTDNLTDLGNHRAYHQDLQRLGAEGLAQGTSLTLAIIDIDELKMINETSGHLEGCQVPTGWVLPHL